MDLNLKLKLSACRKYNGKVHCDMSCDLLHICEGKLKNNGCNKGIGCNLLHTFSVPNPHNNGLFSKNSITADGMLLMQFYQVNIFLLHIKYDFDMGFNRKTLKKLKLFYDFRPNDSWSNVTPQRHSLNMTRQDSLSERKFTDYKKLYLTNLDSNASEESVKHYSKILTKKEPIKIDELKDNKWLLHYRDSISKSIFHDSLNRSVKFFN
jgi:hypothetical protein